VDGRCFGAALCWGDKVLRVRLLRMYEREVPWVTTVILSSRQKQN